MKEIITEMKNIICTGIQKAVPETKLSMGELVVSNQENPISSSPTDNRSMAHFSISEERLGFILFAFFYTDKEMRFFVWPETYPGYPNRLEIEIIYNSEQFTIKTTEFEKRTVNKNIESSDTVCDTIISAVSNWIKESMKIDVYSLLVRKENE